MTGSLTVVGTGHKIGGNHSRKSFHIQIAERVLANVDRSRTVAVEINAPSPKGLLCGRKGSQQTYREMVVRILSHVRAGRRVCAVFYGHPGVACDAGHDALKKARKEGFVARMLPGISAEDCLLADLGIDSSHGCQHLEATMFLISRFRVDVTRPVILWQIGAVGVDTHYPTPELWNREAFDLLLEKLVRTYSPRHRVIVYEASPFPICEPTIGRSHLQSWEQSDHYFIHDLHSAAS
jgi:hypothetical protein